MTGGAGFLQIPPSNYSTEAAKLLAQGFLQLGNHVAHLGRKRAVRLQSKIFLIFVEGAGGIALLEADIGEEGMGRSEIWHLLHGGLGEGRGFLPAGGGEIGFGEFVLCGWGIGSDLQAFLQRSFRGGIIFILVVQAAKIEIGSGEFWFELDAVFQGGFGLLPILLLQVGFAEQAIGLGIVGINFDGLFEMFYAFVGILGAQGFFAFGYFLAGWFGDGEIFDGDGTVGIGLGDDDVCRRVRICPKWNEIQDYVSHRITNQLDAGGDFLVIDIGNLDDENPAGWLMKFTFAPLDGLQVRFGAALRRL